MLKTSYIFKLTLVLSLLTACGKEKDEKVTVAATPVQTLPGQKPGAVLTAVPETMLVSQPLPSKIKARQVALQFRSDHVDATIECAINAKSYTACADGVVRLSALSHGKAYRIAARAVSRAGLRDPTPIEVSFIVDMVAGQALEQEPKAVSARELPQVEPAAPTSQPEPGAAIDRYLQLGSFHAVNVPAHMYVGSYSSDKTYNGRIHMLRRLGDEYRGSYADERCVRDFERTVAGEGNSEYCEATPTRAELASLYANPMPYNHSELIALTQSGQVAEKILVAAYDGVGRDATFTDPTEHSLGIDYVCQTSREKGTMAVPALNRFFDIAPEKRFFSWCQVRDLEGAYFWIGMFRSEDVPGKPYIQVIYTLRSNAGILNGREFAQHAGEVFTSLVTPLAPTE